MANVISLLIVFVLLLRYISLFPYILNKSLILFCLFQLKGCDTTPSLYTLNEFLSLNTFFFLLKLLLILLIQLFKDLLLLIKLGFFRNILVSIFSLQLCAIFKLQIILQLNLLRGVTYLRARLLMKLVQEKLYLLLGGRTQLDQDIAEPSSFFHTTILFEIFTFIFDMVSLSLQLILILLQNVSLFEGLHIVGEKKGQEKKHKGENRQNIPVLFSDRAFTLFLFNYGLIYRKIIFFSALGITFSLFSLCIVFFLILFFLPPLLFFLLAYLCLLDQFILLLFALCIWFLCDIVKWDEHEIIFLANIHTPFLKYYIQYIIKQVMSSNAEKEKVNHQQLAIKRAEFLKRLKIKVKASNKIVDDDRLILIQTFDSKKNVKIEFVMRKLSQLDFLVSHMNTQYGGHIIPVFTHNLYFQNNLVMNELAADIQQYLNDLKHNRYCRQDIKFYCFIIEQHTSFPIQLSFEKVVNNAAESSRKFLSELFTRKDMNPLQITHVLLYSERRLASRVHQYHSIKEIALLKIKQSMMLQQISENFAELSTLPNLAIEPKETEINYIMKGIQSCEKLIEQSKWAFLRWEKLVQSVRDLQNNVFKGLHEYEIQLKEKNKQLQAWSESLIQQFDDLNNYLFDKMDAISGQVYKINKGLVDKIMFSGQFFKFQQNLLDGKKQIHKCGEKSSEQFSDKESGAEQASLLQQPTEVHPKEQYKKKEEVTCDE